jgi:hypothetical protein
MSVNTVKTARIVIASDDDGDSSYLEQDGWEDRLAEYRAGDFDFVGVYLEAEVLVPALGGGGVVTTERSPGLWSIESDCGEDYFRRVAFDEYHEFAAMLSALNCATPANLDLDPIYR